MLYHPQYGKARLLAYVRSQTTTTTTTASQYRFPDEYLRNPIISVRVHFTYMRFLLHNMSPSSFILALSSAN